MNYSPVLEVRVCVWMRWRPEADAVMLTSFQPAVFWIYNRSMADTHTRTHTHSLSLFLYTFLAKWQRAIFAISGSCLQWIHGRAGSYRGISLLKKTWKQQQLAAKFWCDSSWTFSGRLFATTISQHEAWLTANEGKKSASCFCAQVWQSHDSKQKCYFCPDLELLASRAFDTLYFLHLFACQSQKLTRQQPLCLWGGQIYRLDNNNY